MRMRILMTLLSVLFGTSAFAQSSEGVLLYKLGELDLAKAYFQQHVNDDPALDNYYLGQIEAELGNVSAAKQYYEKSYAVNSSIYGEIGLASLGLKNDPKTAKKMLEDIAKKNKKNAPIVIEVAKAFYDNGMSEDGLKIVDELLKAKNPDPNVYILRGDVLQKKGDLGPAAAEYDQAIYFDPNNIVALIKAGLVYERINPSTAIEQFKKALQVDPQNTIVMRFMAKVYTLSARYPQAIALYKEYFASNKYNLDDLSYYSRALYFNKNYEEAKKVLAEALQQDPDNFVFNRLMMYCDEKLNDNEAGLKVAEKFFSLRSSVDSGYLDRDFVSYGTILINLGDREQAILQFDKAVQMNPNNAELYKELAVELNASKLNLEAAEMITNYINLKKDAATVEDYYLQGRYNQSAAQALLKDTLPDTQNLKVELLTNADVAYGEIINKAPNDYQGYYMKAGVNALLEYVNPESKTDITKDLYLKTLDILTEKGELENRKSVAQTAYEYLSIYYYFKYDETKDNALKQKCIEYCDLYLALNPDKESIKNIRTALK